ncbi:hypothetical protein OJF2_63250 [Aquisphaera giovannonii]|uniref:Lipid A biosynthesis lauroyl acyltransferase n=1 Tax=Aquisphaera giovannonii TaxID=406548 RepID=A0A5B9WBT8_9BACT|nr:hypothetical protein [Aquisphaera giovannonii]QEH37734.1 hypothetical protein OJF2_63250 [Aquisphaera giovannonii]
MSTPNPLRGLFHWKFAFYQLLLPAIRALGPGRADAILCALGKAHARSWPPRRRALHAALEAAGEVLDLGPTDGPDGGPPPSAWPDLAAGACRMLARDYLLDTRTDREALGRFEVRGEGALRRAGESDRGAILVGSHFGAHIAGLHWLFRSGLPVRALVQRPPHVSRTLGRYFDDLQPAGTDEDLFLRRGLAPDAAVGILLRARAAIRRGRMVYLCGDIPWEGANTLKGRLLGREHRLLSIWTDLAALLGVPVFHVFCTHLPGGRYRLDIDDVGRVRHGEEREALADYLKNLEGRIAARPDQAAAHLLWPCYHPAEGPPAASPNPDPTSTPRPSRRKPARGPRSGSPSREGHIRRP